MGIGKGAEATTKENKCSFLKLTRYLHLLVALCIFFPTMLLKRFTGQQLETLKGQEYTNVLFFKVVQWALPTETHPTLVSRVDRDCVNVSFSVIFQEMAFPSGM